MDLSRAHPWDVVFPGCSWEGCYPGSVTGRSPGDITGMINTSGDTACNYTVQGVEARNVVSREGIAEQVAPPRQVLLRDGAVHEGLLS